MNPQGIARRRATAETESLSIDIEVRHGGLIRRWADAFAVAQEPRFGPRQAEQQLVLEQVLGREEL